MPSHPAPSQLPARSLQVDVDHNSLELEALARGRLLDMDTSGPTYRVVLDIAVPAETDADRLNCLVGRAEQLNPRQVRLVGDQLLRVVLQTPAHCAPCAAAAAIVYSKRQGLHVQEVCAGLPGVVIPAVAYVRHTRQTDDTC